MFKRIKPGLIPIILTCLLVSTSVSFIYCQPIDTIKAIYEVLAERNNKVNIFQKTLILKDKGIYFGGDNRHLITPLKTYIKQHPNPQVEIFTVILINYIYRIEEPEKVNFVELGGAIKRAITLEDKYISANAFWVYAIINYNLGNNEVSLVYFYAASQLLKEFSTFKYTKGIFIYNSLAIILYNMGEYRNSVNYSLRCYKNIDNERSVFNGYTRIHLLDIIGAAYRKLNMPDSSIIFYRELLAELDHNSKIYSKWFTELWKAIAMGNIGENYLNQGKLAAASNLIKWYYIESTRAKDTLNICLSRNVYARLLLAQGNTEKAIQIWKSIIPFQMTQNNIVLMEEVNSHLATAYRKKVNIDSAFYYHEQRDIYLSRIKQRQFTSGLKRIKEEFIFKKLSNNALYLGNKVKYLKRSRLYALGIILLSSLLGIIIFYLRRKKMKQKLEIQRYKRAMLEQELGISEERNLTLKDRLLERNNLASYLIKRIRGMEQNEDASITLINEIKDYTLATDEGWKKFKRMFKKTHPDFLYNLKKEFPYLSPGEKRLSILLFLKLNNSEIARLLGISATSVYKSRYRLRCKMQLDSSEDLETIINSI